MKSKLKSFSYTGESWEGKPDSPGGAVTYYVQEIVFEDGTKGRANSKSQTPNWTVGAEYTFDVIQDNKGNTKIAKMSKVMQPNTPRVGGYDDPKVQKRMCAAASSHCAVSFAKKLIALNTAKDPDYKWDNTMNMRVSKKFFSWIHVDGQSTDDMFNKKSAIAIAIDEMDINPAIASSADVIDRAEQWFEHINTIE